MVKFDPYRRPIVNVYHDSWVVRERPHVETSIFDFFQCPQRPNENDCGYFVLEMFLMLCWEDDSFNFAEDFPVNVVLAQNLRKKLQNLVNRARRVGPFRVMKDLDDNDWTMLKFDGETWHARISSTSNASRNTLSICHLCNQTFDRPNLLEKHVKRHDRQQSSSLQYRCKICFVFEATKGQLTTHVRLAHCLESEQYDALRCNASGWRIF